MKQDAEFIARVEDGKLPQRVLDNLATVLRAFNGKTVILANRALIHSLTKQLEADRAQHPDSDCRLPDEWVRIYNAALSGESSASELRQ